MSDLSHVDEAGDIRMVDVGGKPLSRRRAVARATVRMAPETARRLRELPKGDALTTAQLAGSFSIDMTNFGIQPPSVGFTSVQTAVTIEFSLNLAKS